jgi:hypothetical protein
MPSSAITLAISLFSTSSRFASIYDAENITYRSEKELMDLAKAKLLCNPNLNTLEKNQSGSLVCLSVHFALEFKGLSHPRQNEDSQKLTSSAN